jgi:hypothetical protein
MSKQENNEELPDKTVSYVYIPDEDIYGTLIARNSYYSIVEYFDNGLGYHIEVDNEDFIIVDEFGITYVDDLEEYQGEEMEENL